MHSFLRMRTLLVGGLCATVVAAHPPTVAARSLTATTVTAKPKPTAKKRSFRLFARALGAFTINRIYCGLNSDGEVCVDSTNSSVIGGGFWPKGTPDQYVFNSGLQIAGVVGSDANPEWQGDTTGAFFFDPKGTTQHGEEVEPVYNTTNSDDFALISDPAATDPVALAARVPSGDATAELYNPLLRGRAAASQGDVWWISWDGNPALNAGRSHPLGIAVEQRGLGWNFPVGNNDIAYFVYTFYNVTAKDPAVYTAAGVRPGMADILAQKGEEFQTKNEQAFGISIPDGGYTVTSLFAAFSADMDVSEATVNFSSVNVPFGLGYVYAHDFSGSTGWVFDPSIFGPPFFPGAGFVGVKYLKSPIVNGQEVGLTLFSNTINGGAFDDAQNTIQLYRYLSNNISTAAGDAACNTGDPQQTHICFVNTTAPDDMRFFQSSGPLELAPGQFGSIVVAYIFAAPAITGSCTGPGTCDLNPGDATRLLSAATLAGGANPIDSVTGYLGFRGPDTSGAVVQDSISTLPGSLLGKALVAQAVFNNGFLLPFAPEAPPFFLVPGDNQVTVLWSPSATEVNGDPFFATASALLTPEGAPNPLYDPNYRQFDVEGYRVYRGRVDNPGTLVQIAQFDYQGTFMVDWTGQVNPNANCAPELGINNPTAIDSVTDPAAPDTTFGCAVPFDSLPPEGGVAPTVSDTIPLVGTPATGGNVIQVKKAPAGRATLATGEAIILQADTVRLQDTGMPFLFLDRGVRSNLRYFYSVVAFDYNSFQSGPSSLESPRNTKPVIPVAGASNLQSTAVLDRFVDGRGANVSQDTTLPTIDPTTGRFSKKFPAANNASLDFVGGFPTSIFSGEGDVSATLIGLGLGDARNDVPINYVWETTAATGTIDTISLSIIQPIDTAHALASSSFFPAATADATLSAKYGVPAGFVASGQVTQGLISYLEHTGFGRGCFADVQFGDASDCAYNGPRWFEGDNETKADPNAGNVAGSGDATDNNNAGELPGVLTIQTPQSYTQMSGGYRRIDAFTAGAVRAADFKVYWGAAGKVDSVIDVTHNVAVPFIADSVGAGWGFLTQAGTTGAGSGDGRPDVLTVQDFGCVFPFTDANREPDQELGCAGASYLLTDTAVPGVVAIYGGAAGDGAAAPQRPNPGFGMWLAGYIFMFELAPGSGVPATGTVWTMRSYIGHINGGNGAAGNLGPYRFTAAPRSFSALGASLKIHYAATNAIVDATKNDLSKVHTVPDPYYVTNQFEATTNSKILKFVNLPADAIIRIYSSSGVLVNLLEHHSDQGGGAEDWNLRNRNNQVVASGVYFYHVEAGAARRVGRLTVVNFAQ
jgi:hypothetical protein